MKKLILILMPLALVVGQHKKTIKKRTVAPVASAVTQSAPAAQAVPVVPPPPSGTAEQPKIPAGAKEVEPFLFGFTDAQGKKWLYRQTPFGVVKWEDKPVTAAPIADNSNPVIITDLGDSVRFQWKTPFGDQSRVRKKSELNDEEKAMMQREQVKSPAPDPLAATKQTDSVRKAPEQR